MLPVIWPGAELRFVPSDGTDAAPGDVVLAERNHCLVAHRVVRVIPGGLITRGDALAHEERLSVPGDVRGIAVGVPLGRAHLPLPRPVALPVNVLLGRLARAARGTRGSLGAVLDVVWDVARRAPALDRARRRLQPYRLEAATRERVSEALLRANRRPTASATARWQAALDGSGMAWLALRDDAVVGWLLAAPHPQRPGMELELWVARTSRGLGVAGSLVETAIATAVQRGWQRLELRASPVSGRWLKRRGFRSLEEDGLITLEWLAAAT